MLERELDELRQAVRDAEILLERSAPENVDEYLNNYIRLKERLNKRRLR